jgi:hypothetical protein
MQRSRAAVPQDAQKQLADLPDAVVDAAPVDSAATLAPAADADPRLALAWPPAPRWDTHMKLTRVGSRHVVVLISVSPRRQVPPPRERGRWSDGNIWPDRDESTRAAFDAVITARPEQRRSSSEATKQRRGSRPVERSHVVVELELVRVRAQPEFVEFGGPLVVQPGLDQVLGEHAALGEEGVVALQGVEHHVQ